MTSQRLSIVPFVLTLAACGGGNEAEFGAARTVPKDQRPIAWDAPAKDRLRLPDMRMAPPAGETQGEKVWVGDTPAGWEALPAQPTRFRDAVWRVAGNPDTECYLTASVGGGVAGNLDRWYEQFGVTPVPAPESLAVIELAGRPARLVELKGEMGGMSAATPKSGWAALTGFVSLGGDQLMTFKFTGPEGVVTANKDKFLALAKSLRSATKGSDPNAPPIHPGAQLPPNHPPMEGPTNAPQSGTQDPHSGTAAAAPKGAAPFTATAPAGWTPKTGTARSLHHGFGSDGEVYVGQLGGGAKQNLDIWRTELSLPHLSDAEFQALPKVAFLGEDSVLLDMKGNFQSMSGKQIQNARVLIAARAEGGAVVFCKLVGPAADVGAQADAFRAFCGSVRRTP